MSASLIQGEEVNISCSLLLATTRDSNT